MASRFYVTTPIYYINDVPHLGSAYTTIAADVLCRYERLRGKDAWFLTGTDEHGLKIQRAAEERGTSPQALADEVSAVFRGAWPELGCVPDDFIRTTEERHKRVVADLWSRIVAKGDIYLGHYKGLYCVGCEGYYTEKELEQPGNVCPLHKKPAETVEEESYFFRLSKYGAPLLEHYAKNPGFVQPTSRLNEVTSFVQGGLEDLSVSRTTFKWGVPVPGDPRHVMFVWFDALTNYYSAVQDPADLQRFWPASVHLVGKDILRFHAVYWPAFLMSAGLPLPGRVFAHGFLTYGGQKMGKALRNTVSPVALAKAISPAIGADVVRYCLMRGVSFGQDGDFSIDDVLQRYGAELGNALGNLLNRVLPFADAVPEKGEPTDLEREVEAALKSGAKTAADAFDAHVPTRALDAVWTVVAAANAYVDRAAPWVAKKKDPARLGTIVATLVEVLEAVATMVAPVMPVVAAAMREQLGLEPLAPEIDRDRWPFELPKRAAGGKLVKGAPIFPRLEKEHEADLRARFAAPKPEGAAGASAAQAAKPPSEGTAPVAKATATKGEIAFDDFGRADLRIGLVVSAERVAKKDRLLDLRVDVGEPQLRRIVAGIAVAYAPESVVGKRVAVLCNLPPRDFGKGVVSHGMLLASGEGPGLRLLEVDGVEPGTPVK